MKNNYTTHIKAKTGWFDIDIKELVQYKDLIFLLVKKNYSVMYKQTILGPLWLILNPIITVLLYTFVFGNIAGLSTDGSPQLAFYLASNALWSYFSACLTQTSTTFTDNSAVFGKVYFPRLVMPISTVVTGVLDLVIQVVMRILYKYRKLHIISPCISGTVLSVRSRIWNNYIFIDYKIQGFGNSSEIRSAIMDVC